MTSPNISHQSGNYRAYVETSPHQRENVLYLMKEDFVLSIADPSIKSALVIDEIRLDSETQSFFRWSDMLEDDLVDMWKAIGKALDVYSDEPGQAYKQGYAEGETKVLREWNETLRGNQ